MRYGFAAEAALREEMVALIVAVPLGYALAPTWGWYVAMLAALLAVLAVELLNTAVEKLADLVTRERRADIGKIKDFGSAAVFCTLCAARLVWIVALGVRLGLL